jgi:hypothetical protein
MHVALQESSVTILHVNSNTCSTRLFAHYWGYDFHIPSSVAFLLGCTHPWDVLPRVSFKEFVM